jgi:acetoin utilization deacetylase AcuC-like enzyme
MIAAMEGTAMRTGLVYDERCLGHDNGSMILDEGARWIDVPHFERAERLLRSRDVLSGAGVLDRLHRIEARAATEDELRLVHTGEHVESIKAACARGEDEIWVGPEARVGRASWEPALVAVGGLLNAVDAVLAGEVDNAFTILRPCGHHASAEQAMGFCLFNNVAIACRHAQVLHGLERIAVVDWDVHHGNGTQAIFYDDASVLFVSLHQDDLYPVGWGAVDHTGEGAGAGYTVNVPLPAGSGDAGYLDAFERVVAPALDDFQPQLILISAGQDPAASDPLGRMSVTTEGFRAMTERARSAAERLCGGRIVVALEGGYSLEHMPYCNLAIAEALAGLPGSFDRDPMELDVPVAIRPEERAAVDRANPRGGPDGN